VSLIGRPVTHCSSAEQICLCGVRTAAGAQSACFVGEPVGASFVHLLRVAWLDAHLADTVGHHLNDDAQLQTRRLPVEEGGLREASMAETKGIEDTVRSCCAYSEPLRIKATFRGATECEVSGI
jgi:hypothetical protein